MLYLHTKNTSYIMRIKEYKKIEHIYYGRRIKEHPEMNREEQSALLPHSVTYDEAVNQDMLEQVSLEYGESGKGDFREPSIFMKSMRGYVTDFVYVSHEYYEEKKKIEGYPNLQGACQTLEILLREETIGVDMILFYHAYYDSDVIVRSTKVINRSTEAIDIKRLMSLSLDFDNDAYNMISFEGAWAREMNQKEQALLTGIYINDSKVGTSSNRHNPFVMLKQKETTEYAGDCYGFNLIYSGNHAEIAEVTPFHKIRFMTGINPHNFSYTIRPKESFQTPEAIMTYSKDGLNGLSQNMHRFIMNAVIPKNFQNKERPILINNWEATYFDFNHEKLVALAKEAKAVGIELFVLDDGWFGKRNDDKTSLGDWFTNEEKLGGTLKELAESINEIGLDFGLWFEPEMISEESELYKKRPEWVLGKGKRSKGRNQLILDLSKEEVCEYIVKSVSDVLDSANISYVKWDMNRNFSDVFSDRWENQGEVCHRYVLGLYSIFEKLITCYPNILFEGCSAGGNRFDLGILSYMPQIWASDDTDGHERVRIQKSISYGYPQSTYGAHVSACPNHQTLRYTPLETRFNISTFGALGYELDLLQLSDTEKEVVAKQIAYYKEHRSLLQFGEIYRLTSHEDKTTFLCRKADKTEVFIGEFYHLQSPNPNMNKIVTRYLDDAMEYEMISRPQYMIKGELGCPQDKFLLPQEKYVGYGDMMNYKGVVLNAPLVGIPTEKTRVIGDFGSRLYELKKIK